MTLNKAIELSEILLVNFDLDFEEDEKHALNLLIEAGKRIERQRSNTIPIHQPPLPGETMV